MSKSSRLFEHGSASLILKNEDCLGGAARLDRLVDVIVTSPPYNVGAAYSGYDDTISRADYLAWLDQWAGELPELPQAREARFIREYDLPAAAARALTAEKDLAEYFEAAVAVYPEPRKIGNWMLSELLRELNQAKISASDCALPAAHLADLVRLIDSGQISGKIGKQDRKSVV